MMFANSLVFNSTACSKVLKPMSTVGPGVNEIRIRTGREHRVLYTANLANVVYVLHAFEKKSQKAPKRELEVARHRFRALIEKQRRKNASKK